VTRGKYETDNVLSPSVPNKSIPEFYRMETDPTETASDAQHVTIPRPIIKRYYWLLVTFVFGIMDVYMHRITGRKQIR
jgi:uncharacterized membrane protein affecting hemolysin expression